MAVPGQLQWRPVDRTKKAKSHFPDKEDVQIASADSVLFSRLTGVMDTTIAAGFPAVALLPGSQAGL